MEADTHLGAGDAAGWVRKEALSCLLSGKTVVSMTQAWSKQADSRVQQVASEGWGNLGLLQLLQAALWGCSTHTGTYCLQRYPDGVWLKGT